MIRISKLLVIGILVVACSGRASAQVREEVRLKLTDGSYLVVDEASETPQGIWYRQGSLSNLLPRNKVKKIERTSVEAPSPAPAVQSTNDDDHFEVTDVVAEAPPKSGNYDQPVWIYLKGGARVEADSATESPAGAWYKRGGMSIFIDRSRIDRIELEAESVAQSGKKASGWSTGRPGLDRLIRVNGSKYNVDPYLIFLVMEQESHFNPRVVSPKGARGLMQLMPGTAARFGVRRPHDPAQNISGGARYLRELLNRFNNRVDLVLAGYNAGEGAVAKFGNRVPPYRETRNYVKKISYRYKRATARTRKPPKPPKSTP
jgi:hypothetical protein